MTANLGLSVKGDSLFFSHIHTLGSMGAGRREKSERGRNDSAELGEKKEKGEGVRAKQNPNTRLLRTKGSQNRVRVASYLLCLQLLQGWARGEKETIWRGDTRAFLGRCRGIVGALRHGTDGGSQKPDARNQGGGRVRVQL